jgi:hypothetical protein
MTGGAVLGVVAAAVTGHLVVSGLCPAPVRWPLRAVHAGLALLTGVALHSLWQFAWVAWGPGSRHPLGFIAYDLALPLLTLATLIAVQRTPLAATRDASTGGKAVPSLAVSSQEKWLPATATLACGIGVVFASNLAASQPDGAWDAWAMWNFKARWLALGGTPWSEILTNPIFATAHPDYPLLLPLSVSRLWTMTGGVPAVVPQALGVCAAAIVAVLLVGAVWALRGPMSAAVAATGLLVLPPFLAASASQLADVPLACCYVATLVALSMGAHGAPGKWFALAGSSAGAAMWTKSEGMLFFACALLSLAGAAARFRNERRDAWGRVGEFVAGAAPFLIATIVVRSMAVQSDLIAGQSATLTWERMTTAVRYSQILGHVATLLVTMPDVVGVIGFLGYLAFRGLARDLRPAMPVMSTLALTAGGYFALYVVTPYELSWHLTTSADRLVVQLWPSVVFAALLLTRHEPVPQPQPL